MAIIDATFSAVNDTATLRNPGGGRAKSAQSYKALASGAITSCKMQMKRLGSPTGNAWIEIYASSSGLPTGSVLATSSTRAIDAFSTSQTLQEFTFPTPYMQTKDSYYCIAICGDWTESNTDTLQANISYDLGAVYTDGLFSFYNGSTWAESYPTHNSDVAFEIYVSYIKKIMGIPRSAHQIADDPLFSDANLQAYWKLENTTDSGPNGYTLTNNGTVTFPAGKFNNGGNFVSASSQYLSIADASCANLEILGTQTWSVWIKPTAVNATQMIMAKQNTGNGRNFYLNSDATIIFAPDGLTPGNITSTQTVSANVWSHVVGRYNSADNTLAIFVNGVKKSVSVTGTPSDTNSEFCIGRRTVSGSNLYFNGMIDDSAIWNRALTDTEIYRLYNGNIKKLNGKTITGGNEIASMPLAGDANLQGYWKLENTTDSSANGYTLTNNGTTTFAAGKFNNAGNFVAASNQSLTINTASAGNLNITGNQTYTAWIKMTTNNADYGIAIIENAADTTAKGLRFKSAGTVQMQATGLTTSTSVTSDVIVPTGVWTFVAGVYNGSNLTVYVNEVSKSATATGTASNITDGSFSIGSIRNVTQWFNGMIDDVSVYNRALTATEISNIYNTQIKKFMGVSNV